MEIIKQVILLLSNELIFQNSTILFHCLHAKSLKRMQTFTNKLKLELSRITY